VEARGDLNARIREGDVNPHNDGYTGGYFDSGDYDYVRRREISRSFAKNGAFCDMDAKGLLPPNLWDAYIEFDRLISEGKCAPYTEYLKACALAKEMTKRVERVYYSSEASAVEVREGIYEKYEARLVEYNPEVVLQEPESVTIYKKRSDDHIDNRTLPLDEETLKMLEELWNMDADDEGDAAIMCALKEKRPLGEIFGLIDNQVELLGGSRRRRGPPRNSRRGRRGGGVARGNRSNQRPRRNRGRPRVGRDMRRFGSGQIMPDRTFRRLIYADPQLNRTLSGGVYNWFYESDAYKVDPTGTANIVPGFAEMLTLYGRWKVHKIKVFFEAATILTNPHMIIAWPSNTPETAGSLTKAQVQQYSANYGGRRKLVGATGSNIIKGSCTATGFKLYGNSFLYDDDFWGFGSTPPSTLFYINMGIIDTIGAEAGDSVVDIRVEMDIEFAQVLQLLN